MWRLYWPVTQSYPLADMMWNYTQIFWRDMDLLTSAVLEQTIPSEI